MKSRMQSAGSRARHSPRTRTAGQRLKFLLVRRLDRLPRAAGRPSCRARRCPRTHAAGQRLKFLLVRRLDCSGPTSSTNAYALSCFNPIPSEARAACYVSCMSENNVSVSDPALLAAIQSAGHASTFTDAGPPAPGPIPARPTSRAHDCHTESCTAAPAPFPGRYRARLGSWPISIIIRTGPRGDGTGSMRRRN